MKKFILSIILSIFTFCVIANDFTIKPLSPVVYTYDDIITPTLIYGFEIENNLPEPLYLDSKNITGTLPNVQLNRTSSTCYFSEDGPPYRALAAKGEIFDSCRLYYTSTLPVLPNNVLQKTYSDSLDVMDNNGLQITYPNFGVDLKRGKTKVYIPNGKGGVTICTSNVITGLLNSCTDTSNTLFVDPKIVTISPDKKYAYIGDVNTKRVYAYHINQQTGTFSDGFDAQATDIDLPTSIAFSNDGKRVYIPNEKNAITGVGTVTTCNVNTETGLFSGCVKLSDPLFKDPETITLSPDNRFAYIGDITSNKIYTCPIIQATGQFGSCIDSGASNIGPPVHIALLSGGGYAYIPNNDATLTICTVNNPTGQFSSCRVVTGGPFIEIRSIGLSPDAKFVYLGDIKLDKIFRCVINQQTGQISGCDDALTLIGKPIIPVNITLADI